MVRFAFLSAAVLAALGALYFLHVQLTAADLPFYRKLVRESADLHAHSALEKRPVRQMRKGVSKDIWTLKEGKRAHGRIDCSTSDLTLSQKKEKMEAVEFLQGIEGWIESEGDVRHIIAESGVCYFPSCRGKAHHLALDLEPSQCFFTETDFQKDQVEFFGSFHIEHPLGRLFGEKGNIASQNGKKTVHLQEGVLIEASSFSLSSMQALAVLPPRLNWKELASENIHFSDGVEIQTTHGIRALGETALIHDGTLSLFPKGESSCTLVRGKDQVLAKEIRFQQEAKELLCLLPQGRLEDSRALFDADTGRVQFSEKDLNPETLLLEGRVQIASYLQGKESFAKADSAIFHVKQKKIILQSSPTGRVLFRQDGLDVSAPMVHIQEAIQGFGDVRFFFYPEETSLLETIFSKYL